LTTAGSSQQNLIALPVVSTGSIDRPHLTEISGFSIAEHSWHPPSTLALLCIRLI
jgi:hypothetical protein